jgi:anti-anti-sigma factor
VTHAARLTLERTGAIAVARIAGEVDLSNAASLQADITAGVTNDVEVLVLDLSETEYLDSAGIRLVFGLADAVRRRGQALRLVVPDGAPVQRVLELCRVGDVAPLRPALDDALASL